MNTATHLALLAGLMDWFIRFPALWAAAGFAVGGVATGVIAFVIFRRYGDALTGANDKLVAIQQKQLDMMERTLRMQKEHYEAEAAETKERYESLVAEAKTEWQSCRKALHDERVKWNEESLKMQLTIQDLEGRPNMTSLGESLLKAIGLIEGVATLLEKHDKSIDERMQQFVTALKPKKRP